MKTLNLAEILKGHEGETFYSPVFGDVILSNTNNDEIYPIIIKPKEGGVYGFTKTGKLINGFNKAECMLFPSKDQRDWNKWIEEQKPKGPKTWSELRKNFNNENFYIIHGTCHVDVKEEGNTPITKAAMAMMRIHQLIEIGYGGNITDKEWKNTKIPKYGIQSTKGNIDEYESYLVFSHIAFHTSKQREEFLSYPENVQLIKDFYLYEENTKEISKNVDCQRCR